jgi:hypothetical protein
MSDEKEKVYLKNRVNTFIIANGIVSCAGCL